LCSLVFTRNNYFQFCYKYHGRTLKKVPTRVQTILHTHSKGPIPREAAMTYGLGFMPYQSNQFSISCSRNSKSWEVQHTLYLVLLSESSFPRLQAIDVSPLTRGCRALPGWL
jgi:hypothetical protein